MGGAPTTDPKIIQVLMELNIYKNTSLGWLDIKDMPFSKVLLIHRGILELGKEEERQMKKQNRKNKKW